jgi:hypothetical protein
VDAALRVALNATARSSSFGVPALGREDDMNATVRRFPRMVAGFLVTAAFCCAAPSAATDRADSVTIAVDVRDEARTPIDVLANAKRELSRIYHHANVRLYFTEASPVPAGTRITLHLTIVSGPRVDMTRTAAGFTHRGPDSRQRYAQIFDSRVTEVSARWGMSKATVLGYVMAHEMGHLLLPFGHSVSGIMRATWDPEAVRKMSQGVLFFRRAQVAAMHARLMETPPGVGPDEGQQ